jgi:tetratricopeptide (TPR) repeat protein
VKTLRLFLSLLAAFLFSFSSAFAGDTFRVSLPGKDWGVEFSTKGMDEGEEDFLPDFAGWKMMTKNPDTGIIMSAFVVPADQERTPASYRDYAFEGLKKSGLAFSDLKQYEKGDKAFTEYLIRDMGEFKGFDQRNLFIYLTHGDTFIDFHLSKTSFKKEDQKLFDEFVSSIKILKNYIPDSAENFRFGCFFYLEKNYKKAASYYQKALEQEKLKRMLPEKFWLVLVDNLGMAYGISGDLEHSKMTYEYGLSQKTEYPLFYYNLGCTYAEMDDLDNAILNLKQAFKYKENMISGETMPDPTTDSSFKKYLQDPKFQECLRTLKP